MALPVRTPATSLTGLELSETSIKKADFCLGRLQRLPEALYNIYNIENTIKVLLIIYDECS